MKSLKFLFAALFLFALASCGHFSDGTSVWAEGLWIIPVITGGGFIAFLIAAYLSSRSGSQVKGAYGKWEDRKENVPIYKVNFFYFAVALLILTVVIIVMVNNSK